MNEHIIEPFKSILENALRQNEVLNKLYMESIKKDTEIILKELVRQPDNHKL